MPTHHSRNKDLQTIFQDPRNEALLENILRKKTGGYDWLQFLGLLPKELKGAVNTFEGLLTSLPLYKQQKPNKRLSFYKNKLSYTYKNMRAIVQVITELNITEIAKIDTGFLSEKDLANLKKLINYYRWYKELDGKESVSRIKDYNYNLQSFDRSNANVTGKRYVNYRENLQINEILNRITVELKDFSKDYAQLKKAVKEKLGELSQTDVEQIYNWLDIQYRAPYLGEIAMTSDCYEITYSKTKKVYLDGVVISDFLSLEERQKAEHVFYTVGKNQSRQQYYAEATQCIRLAKAEGKNVIAHIIDPHHSGKKYEAVKTEVNAAENYENIFRYLTNSKHNRVPEEKITLKGQALDANEIAKMLVKESYKKTNKIYSLFLIPIRVIFPKKKELTKINESLEMMSMLNTSKSYKYQPLAALKKLKVVEPSTLVKRVFERSGFNIENLESIQQQNTAFKNQENVAGDDVVLKVTLGAK